MSMNERGAIALIAAASVVGASGARAQPTLRTAALTGRPAGATGLTFAGLGAPVINADGTLCFLGSVTGAGVTSANDLAIWFAPEGGVAVPFVREGDAAPGAGDGVVFGSLIVASAAINGSGRTVFAALLAGPGVTSDNDVGVWSDATGVLELVVREGDPAPGAETGAVFSSLQIDEPQLNADGLVSFYARLGGPSVFSGNDLGLWSRGAGGASLVLREVGSLDPQSVGFLIFPRAAPRQNAPGVLAHAFLNASGSFGAHAALFAGGPGTPRRVASSLVQVPGQPAGVVYQNPDQGCASVNGHGRAAFGTVVQGPGIDTSNRFRVYAESAGGLVEVVRQGVAAPGAPSGKVLSDFQRLSLNDAGDVALLARMQPGGAGQNDGVWLARSGSLIPLAVEGVSVPPTPGIADGTVFAEVSYNPLASTFQQVPPGLSEDGQVSFLAADAAPAGGGGIGLWATDWRGQLRLIARTGGTLDVDDRPDVTDLRQIRDLSYDTYGQHVGTGEGGRLAFWARFEDGSQGVFVAYLPSRCPGDVNGDTTLDAFDFNAFVDAFNAGDFVVADVNADTTLDAFDFNAFVDAFNAGCP